MDKKKVKIGGSIVGALLVLGAIGQINEEGTSKSEVSKPAVTSEAMNHTSSQEIDSLEIEISPTLTIEVQLTETPTPTEEIVVTEVPEPTNTEIPTPTSTPTPEPTKTSVPTVTCTPIPTATNTPTAKPTVASSSNETANDKVERQYILNTNTKKIHWPTCHSVSDMKEKNKRSYTGYIDDILAQGYTACKNCNPF